MRRAVLFGDDLLQLSEFNDSHFVVDCKGHCAPMLLKSSDRRVRRLFIAEVHLAVLAR